MTSLRLIIGLYVPGTGGLYRRSHNTQTQHVYGRMTTESNIVKATQVMFIDNI